MSQASAALHETPVLPGTAFPALVDPILTLTCGDVMHVAVAVSGGADSLALTLLAHAWASARGGRITAITIDHGLRAESSAEAATVAGWMEARGITHAIVTPPPLPEIRNPQAQARERRYGALVHTCQQLGIDCLLVAHHADDQAETVALQQHRGDSPPSRAGMALVRHRAGIRLIRPLLGVRKRALMAYLESLGQPWITDPSNAGDASARNRLRAVLAEPEILKLWHDAQVQGEARHRDESLRNHWFSAHAQSQFGAVSFPTDAWRALLAPARTDALSHAIRVIGGNTHRPRMAETQLLDNRMRMENRGVATLGHCRIDWNSQTVRIAPEASRPAGLDARTGEPHMATANTAKLLVSEPFWWFNYPLAS